MLEVKGEEAAKEEDDDCGEIYATLVVRDNEFLVQRRRLKCI